MIRTCMVVLAATGLAASALAQTDSDSRCASYRTEADRAECVRTQALNEAAKTPTSYRLIEPPAPAVPLESTRRITTTYETANGKQVRTTEERVVDGPAAVGQEKTTTVTRTTR
jgi:hypothetical protein